MRRQKNPDPAVPAASYGGVAGDTGAGFWGDPYGRLNVGDSRPSKRRVVAVLIAHPTVCSDFRLPSHVSHSRTERALQLASQHVVAGAAVLVLPELSSSHAPHGAIVCG